MDSNALGASRTFMEWVLSWFQYCLNKIIDMVGGSSSGKGGLLSTAWIPLLLFLILSGVVVNIFVYVARWKPHWWWFAKKRMIVDDNLLEVKPRRPASSPERAKPSTIVPVKKAANTDKTAEPDNITAHKKTPHTAKRDIMSPLKSFDSVSSIKDGHAARDLMSPSSKRPKP